jgi:hypothetical protein
MKKFLKSLSVLTVMFLFVSCAAFQTKREVLPDNIFSCTNPSLMLKLDEEFEYKGMFKNDKSTKARSSDKIGFSKQEFHAWYNKKDNKILLILFNKMVSQGWYWIPGKEFNKKSVIQIKREKLSGKNWNTGLWAASVKNWVYNNFLSIGIELNGNYFSKLWVRNFGEQMQVRITYFENIDDTDIRRKTPNMVSSGFLREHEKKFIEEFNKRADAAITFIK